MTEGYSPISTYSEGKIKTHEIKDTKGSAFNIEIIQMLCLHGRKRKQQQHTQLRSTHSLKSKRINVATFEN